MLDTKLMYTQYLTYAYVKSHNYYGLDAQQPAAFLLRCGRDIDGWDGKNSDVPLLGLPF